MRTYEISNRRPESFVSCRVGLELKSYQEDLANVLTSNNINDKANFIVTPIAPPRSIYYDCNKCNTNLEASNELHLLPDLVIPTSIWERQVAVTIGQLPLYSEDDSHAISIFDKLIKHAFYLPTPVIIIDCPETEHVQRSAASIINHNLQNNMSDKLVLIRLPLSCRPKLCSPARKSPSAPIQSNGLEFEGHGCPSQISHTSTNIELSEDLTNDSGMCTSSSSSISHESTSALQALTPDDWNIWNSFRSFLEPDHRIGLCLSINDDIETESEDLTRWTGEPVRMITLSVDRFSSAKGFRKTMRPAGNIREFMRMIALANSLKTSFVVQTKANVDVQDHLHCLGGFCDMLDQEHPDILRAWNDNLLSPLQPLSSNLDSNTYQVFEDDLAKYSKYHDAMVEALYSLMWKKSSMGRNEFFIMVLGAGRGPLVDAMIRAIHKLNLYNVTFNIFALDKNYSSIRSLNYKKIREWGKYSPAIQVEVVEADMRVWVPPERADIIATELLGSFSDNELSPECIEGTWRFATKDTISIPQSYSSFLAPICSYRMQQELYKSRFFSGKSNIHDQLQVVRLSNYYTISDPEKLFTFDHRDLSMKPIEGANRREATLRFYSKVDTVCHGFAGYFSAKLFGPISISTVPSIKTPTMESWFSAFIPIDKPIQMPANTCLEVKFYRKESFDKVWYEWVVVKPVTSRMHSQDGNGTAMSKLI